MIQFAINAEPPADRNGVVRPVNGIGLVTPPATTNTCNAKTNDNPWPEPTEHVAAGHRSAQAPLHQDRVHEQDRHDPGQAQFFAEGRQDEVATRERDELRIALTPPGTQQTAVGQTVQRLHDLVALVVGVGEGSSHICTRVRTCPNRK